ncbi:MAG: hypothetical protein ACOYMH_00090 [Zwartia sp.]
MKIDRNLNLVMQVQTESKGTVFIHSTSISRSVFEQFYLELGKVFSQCFDSINQAHLALSAPQLAYPALKAISKQAGNWDGAGGVQFGLVNEIIRLTNVLVSGERGWESIPFDTAVKREVLNEDEEMEALSSLVFFTAISKVAPKDLKNSFLEMAGALRNWELTSLDSMEFMSGLPILTKKESTGKKAKESSLVS